MLQKFSKNKKYSGFSFIESILSVFLIATGMIAVMSLMASNLRDSMDSRDQIVATLLSQEGVELVRNIRDNNWAQEQPTFTGFPGEIGDCIIDNISGISCGPGSFPLNFDASDGYNHTSGANTKFRRRIRFTNVSSDSVTVISSVTWNNTAPPLDPDDCNLSSKCAYTQTTLTKWGEKL